MNVFVLEQLNPYTLDPAYEVVGIFGTRQGVDEVLNKLVGKHYDGQLMNTLDDVMEYFNVYEMPLTLFQSDEFDMSYIDYIDEEDK